MDKQKMSETIRIIQSISLEEMFTVTSGTTPTLNQLADVAEYIETKYGVVHEPIVGTTVVAPVLTATPARKYNKSSVNKRAPRYIIDWTTPDVQMFLDIALDGEEHSFNYAELNSIMPFSRAGSTVVSNYVRKESRRRGFKVCHVMHNSKTRSLVVHAVKTVD